MKNYSAADITKGLQEKQFSAVEITQHFLDRIEQHDQSLNSFITVTPEVALQQADVADRMRADGKATAITGIPMAQKDIFCTKGIKTTCASKMLADFVPPYDATTVQQFAAAGAVMLGKTNMDEFAMGSSNETSHFGPSKNPWDTKTTPGGSSGGSAAAVAARLAPVATGTDTGGSIRQPAALTGISGLKPTYGLVSRLGMIAFASSLDQGGLFAQSAEDIALFLEVMAGHDPLDSTSVRQAIPAYSKAIHETPQPFTIGVPKEYFTADLDTKIADTISASLPVFEKLGATIKEISLPNNQAAISAYYVIAPAECSSNLARYDGVRYGYRCENPKDLKDLYCRSRGEGFGQEVKQRILLGTHILSAGYYDAYYTKAQKVRRLISQDFRNAFDQVDLILGPTTPSTAFALGSKVNDPVAMYLSDVYTIANNLAGLPGLSIPAGFVNELPVGLQLTGPLFSEAKLLQVAHHFQQHTNWHTQQPQQFADDRSQA
jgi:aspartyl-tRNA(Asn)/glutamyl-tRNA(Gln) amidotransferase subunit A